MENEKVEELLVQYLMGNLSPQGRKEFAQLLSNPQYQDRFSALMQEDFLKDKFLSDENIEIKTAIQQFLFQAIKKDNATSQRVIHFRKWIAAASIILCLASLSWFFFVKKPSSAPEQVTKKTNYIPTDIQPGKSGAILTLSDGTKIVLDSAQGPLAVEGATKVMNVNGKLSYAAQNSSLSTVYNTMSTPNGRQYQLVLADGSKVWLNAASSITYPTVFGTKERRVSITGEAFFEVAHNATQPFFVSVNGMQVQVLGTEFNINSYEDESSIKTTLQKGSVKIIKDDLASFIKPGQQAEITTGANQIIVNPNVDMEQVMAWKNGKFIFQDADIRSVMRQLERWYNVSVTYEGSETNEEFVGIVSRNVNISQILKMLEETGKVSFKIHGNRIIVN